MTRAPFSPSIRRRTVEPALAVLTVALAVVWVREPGFVFDGGILSAAVSSVIVPTTVLVPGLLAISVLARVVRHGVRLAASSVGSADRTHAADTKPLRIGSSLLLGGLAGYTLWWVVASVYVLTIADVGGVLLAPLIALVTGSVLGVLLLGRTALERLRIAREGGHVRDNT